MSHHTKYACRAQRLLSCMNKFLIKSRDICQKTGAHTCSIHLDVNNYILIICEKTDASGKIILLPNY